jgi:asparaginyl-tRNA synthetase
MCVPSTDTTRVAVLTIKSEIMRAAGAFLRDEGFVEILPVILSPITDPLHHETFDGAVSYYGTPYQLTKSMIFHKQIALRTVPKVFCFSPNVRMEPAERASLGRYLTEFVQLDLEVRDAPRDAVLALGERLLVSVLGVVTVCCAGELQELGRDLRVPRTPSERITYRQAAERHGEPFDDALSSSRTAPVWVLDFPRRVREFYDREDPERPETLIDMDLIYPEGYGEALSGGEREFERERIVDRLRRENIEQDRYAAYLEFVELGIPRSAGFGIGIERLTRYVAGLDRIEDARLFPKVPGNTRAI